MLKPKGRGGSVDLDQYDLTGKSNPNDFKERPVTELDSILDYLATPHLSYGSLDRRAAYLPRVDMGCFYYDKDEHPIVQKIREVHELIHSLSVPRTTIGLVGWYTNFGMITLFRELLNEVREKKIMLLLPLVLNLFRNNLDEKVRDKIGKISFHDEVCLSNYKLLEWINEGYTLHMSLYNAQHVAKRANQRANYYTIKTLIDNALLNHRIPFDIYLMLQQFQAIERKFGIKAVEAVYTNITCIPFRELSPSIILFNPEYSPYFRLHRILNEIDKTVFKEKDSIALSIAKKFGWANPFETFDELGRTLLYAAETFGVKDIMSALFDAHFGSPRENPKYPRLPTMLCLQTAEKIDVNYHPIVKDRNLQDGFARHYGLTLLVTEALRNGTVTCPFRIMPCFKDNARCTIMAGKKMSTIGESMCWLRQTFEGVNIEPTSRIGAKPPNRFLRKKSKR